MSIKNIVKAIDASDVMILSMIASCICSWCVYVFVASLIYMAINFWLCRRKLDKEGGNEETQLESNRNK